MKLFEIFNKLTEPKNINTYSHKDYGEYELSWTTSKGNRIKLYIQYDEYGESGISCDVSFTVNNSTKEISRTTDPEIMSSIFYKIKQFIKRYNVKKIIFEPYEDIDDYDPNSSVKKDIEQIYELSKPHMDRDSLHELNDYLKIVIQNGEIQKTRLYVINSFIKDFVPSDVHSKINKIIVNLTMMTDKVAGLNRRERIYIYAIKKYLPTWKVSKNKNYIIVSGDSDEIA
jgi:hypothetical protein